MHGLHDALPHGKTGGVLLKQGGVNSPPPQRGVDKTLNYCAIALMSMCLSHEWLVQFTLLFRIDNCQMSVLVLLL